MFFINTSKWHKLLVCFFIIILGCDNDRYTYSNESFQNIIISNWESNKKPYKIVLEKYKLNTNFNQKIDEVTNFETIIDTSLNEIFISPLKKKMGKVDTDLKLTINDTLIYEISNIKSSKDTVFRKFGISRTFHVYNAIDTLNINGKIMIKKNTGHIYLSTKMAKMQIK